MPTPTVYPSNRLCPTCGRRHRRRRVLATLPWETSPLGAWRPIQPARTPRIGPEVRLVLLPGISTGDGDPRPALVVPGRRAPVAYATMAAAIRAKAAMEAGR